MTLLTHPPVRPMVVVSATVFLLLLAALAQTPVLGQILVPVLLIHSGATWMHSLAKRRDRRPATAGNE